MKNIYEKIKNKYKEFDIFEIHRVEDELHFSTRMEHIEEGHNDSQQISLRILKDNHVGFATIAGAFALEEMESMALRTLPYREGEIVSQRDYTCMVPVKIYDLKIRKQTMSTYKSEIKRLMDSKELYCDGRICRIYDQIKYINNFGEMQSYEKTILKINYIAKKNGMNVHIHDASCQWFDIFKKLYKKLDYKNELPKIDIKQVNNGIYTVFSEEAVKSILVGYFGLYFNGKRAIYENLKYSDWNKNISLFDSGIEDWKVNSQPFDDEGIKCRKYPLVYRGKIENFYLDLTTGKAAKTKSTGNARRGWGVPPSPFPNNLILQGENRLDNLLGCENKIIYIEEIMAEEQTRLIQGKYYGKVTKGYYIEKGKKIGKMNHFNVFIDIDKMLKQDIIFENNQCWVDGEFNTGKIFTNSVVYI